MVSNIRIRNAAFAALALLPALAMAQTTDYRMVVNTQDGGRSVYPTSQITSVDFTDESPTPTPGSGKIVVPRPVVFLGHSIWRNDNYTVSYANSGTFVTPFSGSFKGYGYQSLLQERFQFQQVECPGPNGGYSGYSLGGTSATDSKSIAVVAQSSTCPWPALEGAIWTVDFITNDFKRNIPVGVLNDYKNNTGAATFYGALRVLADKIKALSGTSAIVITANALKRNNSNYTSTSKNTVGATLADYELAMLTVSNLNGWYFVDQNRLSGITDENLPATTADGLHLTNLGYRMAVIPWMAVFEEVAAKL
ncbi:MAG: SGNH/GDSL hydrolase family protein [Bacteroidaceae bacterium]|nr:SGNH/GDSL hydrolase family protein [Bacteroidaceae bacterium]